MKKAGRARSHNGDGTQGADGFVRVRGARQNNLKDIDVDFPRDALGERQGGRR